MKIRCPECYWEPGDSSEWSCEMCGYIWNMFETAARCPQCGHQHEQVYCLEWEGGCGTCSPYYDWVKDLDNALLELNITKDQSSR